MPETEMRDGKEYTLQSRSIVVKERFTDGAGNSFERLKEVDISKITAILDNYYMRKV